METTSWHTFVLLVWILQLFLTPNGTFRTAERCGNETEQLEIPLNCSRRIIHVESELIGTQGNSCHVIGDNCRQVRETSDRQLEVNCNGHQSCDEVVKTSNVICGLSDYAVQVNYKCITDSMDMCAQVNGRVVAGSVYLHSPGFPNSVGVSESCNCSIIGSGMTVTLVEYNMTQGSLDISSDGIQIWPNEEMPLPLYNTKLKEDAASVVLLYKNDNHLNENVWIKIRGASSLKVTCNTLQGTTAKVSIPTYISSTQTPRRSDLTTEDQHTDFSDSAKGTTAIQDLPVQETTSLIKDYISRTPTDSSIINSTTDSRDENISSTVIVGVVCGVIIFILLFIIAVLIYCNVLKRSQSRAPIDEMQNDHPELDDSTLYITPQNEGQQGSSDTMNAYSDLSRHDNQSSEHDYGKIDIYNNTGGDSGSVHERNTYTGLSKYVNQGDYHDYGEIQSSL